MRVFFYGLFMDETLLATKGLRPGNARVGFVDGFRLRIGDRATLVRDPKGRSYGVLMDISAAEATALYADRSVADYQPESVSVQLMDGPPLDATCYNLPVDKATGANRQYAEALLSIARNLGFPDAYLEQIRQAR